MAAAAPEAAPVRVGVAVAGQHACAMGPAGEVMCWGLGDDYRLGTGSIKGGSGPVRVPLPGPASSLAAAFNTSCAVVGGKVLCWGRVQWLTRRADQESSGPVELPGVEDATEVLARPDRICAVRPGGLACWDEWYNENPLVLPFWGGTKARVRSVSFAGMGVCALTEEGKVQCWGGTL